MISDETVKAGAEAVQSTAEASGKFADLAGKAGAFVAKIIGGPAEQLGELVTDRIRLYRYKNLCAIADKVQEIQRKRRIDGKPLEVPPKLAIPMLESASLEDDDTLQGIWARLIANATEPSFQQLTHPGFLEVVKQLSADESIILRVFSSIASYPVLFTSHANARYTSPAQNRIAGLVGSPHQPYASYEKILEEYQRECSSLQLKRPELCLIYLDNLIRLRLVELGHDFSASEQDRYKVGLGQRVRHDVSTLSVSIPAREEYLRVTTFGRDFMAACIADAV